MADKTLVIAPSGYGKTHSLKYLNPEETFIFCCDRKQLPFKGWKKNYKTTFKKNGSIFYGKSNYVKENRFRDVIKNIAEVGIRRPEIKVIVVDTITHAMVQSVIRERDADWEKYIDFAVELNDLFNAIDNMREDLHVIIFSHEEITEKNGKQVCGFKHPAGRFGREKIDPESLFTTVLFGNCKNEGEKTYYWFETQNNGRNTCKSPEGMFPEFKIPNNMDYVIKSVFAYDNDQDLPKMPDIGLSIKADKKENDDF